jgi:hypothetical protein
MPTPQARYWLATLDASKNVFTPRLCDGVDYLKGQLELGSTGYLHWQFIVYTSRRCSLAQLKRLFPRDIHLEPTRSAAAADYVFKDDTCADTTSRFELGAIPMRRNSPTDWDAVRRDAALGNLTNVPSDIYVRYYQNLKRIASDAAELTWRNDINCVLFWGDPGTGKTRRAFEEATANDQKVYIKTGTTKWWDGYRGETNVIIDDFSGLIRVDYIKTWLDRYPCRVEVKGGTAVLKATNFWVTSNLAVDQWYPRDVDCRAVKRRFSSITHFTAQ